MTDHTLDALRYLCASLERVMPGSLRPEEREEEREAAMVRRRGRGRRMPQEPVVVNTICADSVIAHSGVSSNMEGVIGHSFVMGVTPTDPGLPVGAPASAGEGYYINLLDDQGFGKLIYVVTKECPKYCTLMPNGEVVAIEELPKEALPGDRYFQAGDGVGSTFHEVSIEVPITPKKRVLET